AVHRVAAPAALDAEVDALARRLAALPEAAVHMTKTQLRAYGRLARLGDVAEAGGDLLRAASRTAAACAAFRPPAARPHARRAAERLAVVVGPAVQVRAAAEAREEQRAARRAADRRPLPAIVREPHLEVVGRGLGVAHVELHDLALVQRRRHRQPAALGIGAD